MPYSFAVNYVRNGGNLLYLQKALGHETLQMTRRYIELNGEDLIDDALENLVAGSAQVTDRWWSGLRESQLRWSLCSTNLSKRPLRFAVPEPLSTVRVLLVEPGNGETSYGPSRTG